MHTLESKDVRSPDDDGHNDEEQEHDERVVQHLLTRRPNNLPHLLDNFGDEGLDPAAPLLVLFFLDEPLLSVGISARSARTRKLPLTGRTSRAIFLSHV